MATKTILLTSGSTWTLPSDLDTGTNATITPIGGGGGGAGATSSSVSGGGGGGGAWATVSLSLSGLTPGTSSLYVSLGSGGSGGGAGSNGGAGTDTWLNKTSNAAPSSTSDGALAKGGAGGTTSAGGAGGSSASSVGSTKNSGGAGGNVDGYGAGGGGGGSAGHSSSAGGAGGSPAASSGGSTNVTGGGGGGGWSAGANSPTGTNTNGGTGGNDSSSTSPNNGGTSGGNGGTGANCAGGGGGGGINVANGGHGGAGGTGTENAITAGGTAGSGGGGGGGGGTYSTTPGNGAAGGLYGAGGGGGGQSYTLGYTGSGAAGAQGALIITYTVQGSVALTGVSATASAGTLGSTLTQALTGNSATGEAGTVTIGIVLALSGVAATGSVGTLLPFTPGSISGVQGDGAVGTLGVATEVPLTGNVAIGAIGAVVAGISLPITGVAATGSVGSVAIFSPPFIEGRKAMACLAKISPLNPATGTRTDIYVSSVNDPVNGPLCNGLNGVMWEPALLRPPSFTTNLWNGDFVAPADPGAASIALGMESLKKTYAVDGYYWIGAPVIIYAETAGAAWPWTTRFLGTVSDFSREAQTLTLRAEVDKSTFQKNVLTATYAGTGNAEGGADIKNKLKPLAIGWAMNVEPVLINAVNSVYQFSGYGAIEGVTTLYEKGSDFGAAEADYASYATLVAATITPGRWSTCLAEGLVRLGAPQAGVITGDIKGHKVGGTTPRLSGAMISALAGVAGVSSGLLETSTLAALDSAAPYNINMVLTEQVTWLEISQRLALHCNYMPVIGLTGKFGVNSVSSSGTEVLTLNAQGAALPLVKNSTEQDVSVPYFKTVMGANHAWRVHTFDEIAFYATIIDRGRYDAAEFYREGNIVDSADGSRWIYINPVPGSGNAPPTWPTTSNAWWESLSPPLQTGKTIAIAQTTQIITYDGAGALDPGTQTNTFTITRQNTTNTCNWTLADTLGNTLTPATYLSATSGDTVDMTAANFSAAIAVNGAQGVIVTATVVDGGSITDVVSVFKLVAGSNALVGFLTNESVGLAANSSGTVSSFATATGTFKVFYGTVDVTASSSFAETTETNCTGTVNASTGVYSVSALSADNGEYVMTATYLGTPIVKTFSLSKAKAGTNGSNGGNGSNGTRTATLYMYKWASSAPATFPSGTSTYTWATAQFTDPGTLNGWSRALPAHPGGAVALYRVTQIFTDSDTSTTDTVTWSATSSEVYTPTIGDIASLNAIGTVNINANAVTLLTSAYTAGTASWSASTWTTLQTITFTATGAPVSLKASAAINVLDLSAGGMSLRITRDGTDITGSIDIPFIGADSGPDYLYYTLFNGAILISDTPSAASHTYNFQINTPVASGVSATATNRYLEALETKK